jgi:hypothetical protein
MVFLEKDKRKPTSELRNQSHVPVLNDHKTRSHSSATVNWNHDGRLTVLREYSWEQLGSPSGYPMYKALGIF